MNKFQKGGVVLGLSTAAAIGLGETENLGPFQSQYNDTKNNVFNTTEVLSGEVSTNENLGPITIIDKSHNKDCNGINNIIVDEYDENGNVVDSKIAYSNFPFNQIINSCKENIHYTLKINSNSSIDLQNDNSFQIPEITNKISELLQRDIFQENKNSTSNPKGQNSIGINGNLITKVTKLANTSSDKEFVKTNGQVEESTLGTKIAGDLNKQIIDEFQNLEFDNTNIKTNITTNEASQITEISDEDLLLLFKLGLENNPESSTNEIVKLLDLYRNGELEGESQIQMMNLMDKLNTIQTTGEISIDAEIYNTEPANILNTLLLIFEILGLVGTIYIIYKGGKYILKIKK